ncbi:hypothetical protein [Jatrophihabitans endophyticus]|uniref:hypothetical protein n=1 Tax=Jatrophihabitans endophyticus TaxID=1206085 RepID=UPI0011613DFE|nr:hypothetical protein [Jatrophihabitans endophyticus]
MAAVGTVLVITAPSALAASGKAYTSDTGHIAGHTTFDDRIDVYTVYDDDKDSVGVVGWIQVQQANGGWATYEHVYVGTGEGTSRSAYHDITRESSPVRIWACRQNGASGTPFSCGTAVVAG